MARRERTEPHGAEVARRVLFRVLRGLRGGRVEIVDRGRRYRFGDSDAELAATVEVHDPRAYAATLRGSIGWGESFVDGWWSTDDLAALCRIAARNVGALDRLRVRLHPVIGPAQRAIGLLTRENSRADARRNISAHYDLGNRLFESFLDRRLVYSCAVFADESTSLEDAQLAKLERACERLALGPDDHLIEIGTGWGAMAIHAAATRGCRVTTTTISREQYEYAVARVADEGLSDRVEVIMRDYRDLEGSYDKLVSIEMIEAVGWQYLPTFFEKCASLLRPHGAMFLQAIVTLDDLYGAGKGSRNFLNTHIFPGGSLPSERVIKELAARSGIPNRWSTEISADYALTLAHWRSRFNESWPELRPHGYDERFHRLWNFYFALCEGAFRERRIRDLQFLLAKPGFRPDRGADAELAEELATA